MEGRTGTAHAGDYDVDPDRLALMGSSAGGDLATLLAYTAGTGAITSSCPTGTDSGTAVSAVRAVVDEYGPTDLTSTARDAASTEVPDMIATYLGGTPDQYPDRARRVSALSYVRPGLPPTLMLHGTHDIVVPYQQSVDLHHALTAAGVPNQLVTLPATSHGIYTYAKQIAVPVIADFLTDHLRH